MTRDRFTSLDPKNGFDTDGQARPGADGPTAASTPGMNETLSSESCGMVKVSLGAEQHLLMRNQSAEPDTMHSNAVNLGSAGPG